MKGKFIAVLLVLSFIVSPSLSLAAPSDSELESYLSKIDWTKSELEEYLGSYYDLTFSDFEDMTELSDFLGLILTKENALELLEQYELSLEEATAFLTENGKIESGQTIWDTYTFLDDLNSDLSSYYLTPVSEESLQQLLKNYDLTIEELNSLLKEYDDSLENYEYIEDLESMIDYYLYEPEPDANLAEMEELFSQIGFTEEELDRLLDHMLTLDLEDPAFLQTLEDISTRMMAFEDFDSASELTAAQTAELMDISMQSLRLFQFDVNYYLVKDGEKKAITFNSLFTMTDAGGYGLLIELYSKQGDFLADFLFSADMFGSDLITETGKDLKKAKEVIGITDKKTGTPEKLKKPEREKLLPKAEQGGKLPDTASDYVSRIASGLAILLFGSLLRLRFLRKNA